MSQPSTLGWKQQLYKIFLTAHIKLAPKYPNSPKKRATLGFPELLQSQSPCVLCLFPSAETNLTHSVLRQLEKKMQHKLVQMQRKHKDPVKGGSSTTNPPPHTHPPPLKKKMSQLGLDCSGDFPSLRLIIRQGCCWRLGTDEDLAVSGEHLGGGEEVAGPE